MTASEVEVRLAAAGFVHARTRGSHFVWVHPSSGRTTVVPHHGDRPLPQGLLLAIFRQSGVPKPRR